MAIPRTIYVIDGKPISLAYVPALDDEHPEARDEPPARTRRWYDEPAYRRALRARRPARIGERQPSPEKPLKPG
jgi:hypothetical protein